MRKTCDFHDIDWERWPLPSEIRPFFMNGGHRWASPGGNDGWYFLLEDIPEGKLSKHNGHSRVILRMTGLPNFGVTLEHDQWDEESRTRIVHCSKGNLARLFQFVRDYHTDQHSLGLFIPFETAWLAVKQFLEADGALPTVIDWVNDRDLPPEAFPSP